VVLTPTLNPKQPTKPKFHHKMALTFQNNRERERNEYANRPVSESERQQARNGMSESDNTYKRVKGSEI